jgi:glycosyltransferase involved in cell wall biosynthesis
MKILNVMFGKGLGGIEQVFLDYNHALKMQNNVVIPIIHPKAAIKERLEGNYLKISNINKYDIFAIHKIRKVIEEYKPHVIITHGNRATSLCRNATTLVPIVAVCHNYKFKPLLGSNAIIAITQDIKEKLIKAGQKESSIYQIPNMICISDNMQYKKVHISKKPKIGVIARLVKKKGVDLFIQAMKILNEEEFQFEAVIAGDGEERKYLEKLIKLYNLEDKIKLIGWVANKEDFYNDVDIVCIPSRHEPFGLVLLEAFLFSKPVICSKTEGPIEIATNEFDACLFETGNADEIAVFIKKLVGDKEFANKISKNAFGTVQKYSVLNISRKLQTCLEDVYYKLINQIQ